MEFKGVDMEISTPDEGYAFRACFALAGTDP
jgi:hypothetical protein